MKDIISINYDLLIDDIDVKDFESKHSLSDADIVLFNPKIDEYSFSSESTYRGKKSFSLNTSTHYIESTKHWNKEIISFLESGKNVFIFLYDKEEFYLDSGKRQTSGTGRNQKVTHLVDEFHNYKFLPIKIELHNSEGKKVFIKNKFIKPLINDFPDTYKYKVYIDSNDNIIEPLILNRTKDKIVSGVIKYKNGNIIFLPYIEPIYDDFYNDEDELDEKGIIHQKKIISNILEIDKSLIEITEKSPRPNWIDDQRFLLKNVLKVEKEIRTKLEIIKEIEKKISELNVIKSKEEILLDLIFETGKPLENAVIRALEILGYNAENFDNGVLELDQVILSPEGNRYIGECEGKENKSVDISKFRQLQDALNEDFQREEIEEKAFGLLFGNPFRNIELDERKDFFTTKCIKGAEREKIGLIKTIDLFFICKYLTEHKNENFKKKCRQSIHNGLGGIIEFPTIPEK